MNQDENYISYILDRPTLVAKATLHFNSSLHSQSAVVVSEQCDRGQELDYVVFYTSSSGPQSSFTISPESCTNSVCQHTLICLVPLTTLCRWLL